MVMMTMGYAFWQMQPLDVGDEISDDLDWELQV
jgi:hypothetical protein